MPPLVVSEMARAVASFASAIAVAVSEVTARRGGIGAVASGAHPAAIRSSSRMATTGRQRGMATSALAGVAATPAARREATLKHMFQTSRLSFGAVAKRRIVLDLRYAQRSR